MARLVRRSADSRIPRNRPVDHALKIAANKAGLYARRAIREDTRTGDWAAVAHEARAALDEFESTGTVTVPGEILGLVSGLQVSADRSYRITSEGIFDVS